MLPDTPVGLVTAMVLPVETILRDKSVCVAEFTQTTPLELKPTNEDKRPDAAIVESGDAMVKVNPVPATRRELCGRSVASAAASK
jgi:hypothetical protein